MTISNLPFVSIILPIHNESMYIEQGLNSVLNQDYPWARVEILIADGVSSDDTRKIISRVISQNPKRNIRILDNPGKIVPTGMNVALGPSKGEIIIRVDGHCIIAPDYVRKCVEHIQNDKVDGVGGPMKSIGETFLSRVIAIGMSSSFGVGNSAFRTLTGRTMLVDTVPFPAYTRRIIERVGLYDEELVRNQDDEYNYRIREMGGKILLAEDIHSTYFSRTSIKGLWRQYYQYGFWKVRVLQKHPRQMSLRHFVPALFVFASFLSLAVWLLLPPLGIYLVVGVIGSYVLANLFASVWSVFTKSRAHSTTSSHSPLSAHHSPLTTLYSLLLLPLVFAILHVGYGTGFLIGLVRFAGRWNDKQGKTPVFDKALL